ncbi:MAG: family 16 glycosylhydrolase [Alicyclobacillus sp.]|nr:family 16 glycosylhydrolase [Alicyclobacillus sp.]
MVQQGDCNQRRGTLTSLLVILMQVNMIYRCARVLAAAGIAWGTLPLPTTVPAATIRSQSPRMHLQANPRSSTSQAGSAAQGQWRLVWSDDFNGRAGAAPDPSKWGYDIGTGSNGWGNNELEYYTDSRRNAYLDGKGHLVIAALAQELYGSAYTSARLYSKNAGNWRYGKIVVRAKLPVGGQGIWPAIWLLPTDNVYGTWPVSGEIDMMEMVGNDPLTVWGTIHYGLPWVYRNASYHLPDSGFHTYTLVWGPTMMRWYVDGHLYQTQTVDTWYSSMGPRPAPFDQRFHLMLNLAVGGNWPGDPDANTKFPQHFVIDSVRVYQQSGEVAQPATAQVHVDAASMDGAHVEACADTGQGQDARLQSGAHLRWKLIVPQTGAYVLQARVANQQTGRALQVFVDGKGAGTLRVPDTGGSQRWRTVGIPIQAAAGQRIVTLRAVGSDTALNWVRMVPTGVHLVTDFQDMLQNPNVGTYTDGGASITLSSAGNIRFGRLRTLRMDYQEDSGGIDMWYVKIYQDWQYEHGIQLKVYGQGSGRKVQVELEALGDERFDASFRDDFRGWRTISLPFKAFSLALVQPSSLTVYGPLNLSDVNAVNVGVLSPGQGTLYFGPLSVY